MSKEFLVTLIPASIMLGFAALGLSIVASHINGH